MHTKLQNIYQQSQVHDPLVNRKRIHKKIKGGIEIRIIIGLFFVFIPYQMPMPIANGTMNITEKRNINPPVPMLPNASGVPIVKRQRMVMEYFEIFIFSYIAYCDSTLKQYSYNSSATSKSNALYILEIENSIDNCINCDLYHRFSFY